MEKPNNPHNNVNNRDKKSPNNSWFILKEIIEPIIKTSLYASGGLFVLTLTFIAAGYLLGWLSGGLTIIMFLVFVYDKIRIHDNLSYKIKLSIKLVFVLFAIISFLIGVLNSKILFNNNRQTFTSKILVDDSNKSFDNATAAIPIGDTLKKSKLISARPADTVQKVREEIQKPPMNSSKSTLKDTLNKKIPNITNNQGIITFNQHGNNTINQYNEKPQPIIEMRIINILNKINPKIISLLNKNISICVCINQSNLSELMGMQDSLTIKKILKMESTGSQSSSNTNTLGNCINDVTEGWEYCYILTKLQNFPNPN